MKFAQYLEIKFLEWQRQQGGRKTVKQFAEFVGVSQSSISMWWHGERVPEGENIRKIADKLGLEVYDVLGIPRPDEDLHYLQSIWNELSPNARRALRKKGEEFRTGNESSAIKTKRAKATY